MGAIWTTDRSRSPGEVGSWGELTVAEERESEQSIPRVFAERVAVSPDAVALEGLGSQVSYAELDRRSNQIASGLLAETGPSGPVGLLVGDGVGFLVALLGTLKAGRIALPLDPRAPEAALAATLASARAAFVLGDPAGPWTLPLALRSVSDYARESEAAVAVELEPGDGALLAFTSGSTGEPRGHLRSHRMLVHHALRDAESMEIHPGTRVGLLLSPVFSRAQPLRALLSGATVLRYDTAATGLDGAARWLTDNRVEVISLMPSMVDPLLSGMNANGLPTLRAVGLGGEKVGRARAEALRRALRGEAQLVHSYASTEGSRICCQPLEGPIVVDDSPLPVGFALPGFSVALRDDDGAPAESGEIVVESRYLATRWNPDGAGEPEPLLQVFSTRDYGSVDNEGRLSILGRVDRMAKIRGYRVQLDAVEQALLGLPSVRSSAVISEPSPRGTGRLVAYVELDVPPGPSGSSGGPAAEVRRGLERLLPEYMVPSRVVPLERLPLLPNGKIDLRAVAESAPGHTDAPPSGATEEALAGIWASVLEIDEVGRDDDFLELGGDSLSAAIVTAEVFAVFGVELSPSTVEECPTVARMAGAIDELRASRRKGRPPLTRASRPGPFPLTVVQETYWHDSYEDSLNLVSAVELRGPLEVEVMERAIAEIVRRHETLRTTLLVTGTRAVQVVQPEPFYDWTVTDLRDRPDPSAAADELFALERATSFVLERGPLARFRLVRTGDDRYQLIRALHHLVSDGWSTRIFFRELSALYAAYRAGEQSPLPELPIQFRDYAFWERAQVRRRSRFFWEELAWWRRALTPRPEPLQLPFLRPAPVVDTPVSEGNLTWIVPTELANELDRLERDCAASYFVVRLAAFAAHLLQTTGRRDLVFGVNITARRLPELQGLIGLFANMTLLRLRVEGEPTLREWILYVRRTLAETSEHFAIPYGAFPWAFRGVPIGVPGLDAIVGGERADLPWQTSPLPGLELREPDGPRSHSLAMPRKFDLMFLARTDRTEPERGIVRFDARKYDPALVRAFLDGLAPAIADGCAHPDAPFRFDVRPSRPLPTTS